MEFNDSPVCVLGVGHLAAAVRVQLRCRSHDAWPALFLACSDFENTSLRLSLARRVRADGASILFACLSGRQLRVGPLVTPHVKCEQVSSYLTRSWDFGRADSARASLCAESPHVDTGVAQVAQIGATLIVGELAKFSVAEFDSPLSGGGCEVGDDSEVTCDETFVAGGVRWRAVRNQRQVRGWHPAGLG
jgi:hypothetical protein